MEIDDGSISEFEHNHDIDSFVFETPFTRGGIVGGEGQSQSGPREQWKRQTILKSNPSLIFIFIVQTTYFLDFGIKVQINV